MRQNTSRNPGRSDVDIALERRGTMGELTDEQRAAFETVAELMGGCERAAAAINRDRQRRAQVSVVPADGRRQLKSTTGRPILVGLPGGDAGEDVALDPAGVAWARLQRSAEHSLLSLPLNHDDAAVLRRFAATAQTAAVPPPPQPA